MEDVLMARYQCRLLAQPVVRWLEYDQRRLHDVTASAAVRGDETMSLGVVDDNGILLPESVLREGDAYRMQWEKEAREDAVYSATGRASHGNKDYGALTITRQPLWMNFPQERHFRTILEIGCGYGRVPMLLSGERGVTCDRYVGVDISINMLRLFKSYRDQFDIFTGATFDLICDSSEKIQLEDDSVDLVISSGVFLHMGKAYVRATLAAVARFLVPGGAFVFDTCFPNRLCLGNMPVQVYGLLAREKPNRAKTYRRREIVDILTQSGLAEKAAPHVIEACQFLLCPARVRRFDLPLVNRMNRLVRRPPVWAEDVLAAMYSVHTPF